MTKKRFPGMLVVVLLFVAATAAFADTCVVRVLAIEPDQDGMLLRVENRSSSGRLPGRFAVIVPAGPQGGAEQSGIRVGEYLTVTVEPTVSGFVCREWGKVPGVRTICDGRIAEILLASEGADPDVRGLMTVQSENGLRRSFLVHRYTLILVRSLSGGLYAGTLPQLRVGWKCSVAFDVPDDHDEYDVAANDQEHDPKVADNMIVDYAPSAPKEHPR